MPIIGLSDRGLSFPEIGHIRKGTKETRKSKDGKTYEVPVDLDYFNVTFDKQESDSEGLFREEYGEQPQEIGIMLPFDEIERMWDPYLEAYTAGRMIARSDGEYIISRVDSETGEWTILNGLDKDGKRVAHPPDNVAGKDFEGKDVHFQPVGRLKVIVPVLKRAAYMTVHTTSYNDIVNISDQLRGIQYMFGRLTGVELVLKRRPRMVSTPGKQKKGRVRREKWLLSIEADPVFVAARIDEVKRLALPNGAGLPDYEEANLRLPPGRGKSLEDDPDNMPMEDEVEDEGLEDPVDEQAVEAKFVPLRHPEEVKAFIEEKAKGYKQGSAGEKHGNMLASALGGIFGGDETRRYEMCKWLFGVASTKDMTDGQVKAALVDWLGITNWNQPPSEQGMAEAKAILGFALEQAGYLSELED